MSENGSNGLRTEERYSFEANGFLVVPRALSEGDVRTALDELAPAEAVAEQYGYEHQGDDLLVAGGRLRSVANPLSTLPIVLDLALHPGFCQKIHELLGGTTRLLSNEYFVTPPGATPRISWHRDLEEANHPTLPLGDSLLTINALVLLSDVGPENAPTIAIPGSHRWRADREFPSEWRGVADPHALPGSVPLCAPRGSVVFFNSRLYHSQSRNSSPDERRALVLVYGQRWMREFDGYVPTGDAARALARNAFEEQFLGLLPGYYCDCEPYVAPARW